MKRRDLEKHLKEHGCEFARHGADHDIWENPANDQAGSVPRHREIRKNTVRSICRQLGIPSPPNP